jgi:hypothetical protein
MIFSPPVEQINKNTGEILSTGTKSSLPIKDRLIDEFSKLGGSLDSVGATQAEIETCFNENPELKGELQKLKNRDERIIITKFFDRLILLLNEDLEHLTAKTPVKDVEFALEYIRKAKTAISVYGGWLDSSPIKLPDEHMPDDFTYPG